MLTLTPKGGWYRLPRLFRVLAIRRKFRLSRQQSDSSTLGRAPSPKLEFRFKTARLFLFEIGAREYTNGGKEMFSYSAGSAQGVVDSFLHQKHATLVFLAAVSQACSASTLSAWLKGEAQLSPEKQKQLVDTVRVLRSVSDSMPLPAAYRDIVLWKIFVRKYQAAEAAGTLPSWAHAAEPVARLKNDVLTGAEPSEARP